MNLQDTLSIVKMDDNQKASNVHVLGTHESVTAPFITTMFVRKMSYIKEIFGYLLLVSLCFTVFIWFRMVDYNSLKISHNGLVNVVNFRRKLDSNRELGTNNPDSDTTPRTTTSDNRTPYDYDSLLTGTAKSEKFGQRKNTELMTTLKAIETTTRNNHMKISKEKTKSSKKPGWLKNKRTKKLVSKRGPRTTAPVWLTLNDVINGNSRVFEAHLTRQTPARYEKPVKFNSNLKKLKQNESLNNETIVDLISQNVKLETVPRKTDMKVKTERNTSNLFPNDKRKTSSKHKGKKSRNSGKRTTALQNKKKSKFKQGNKTVQGILDFERMMSQKSHTAMPLEPSNQVKHIQDTRLTYKKHGGLNFKNLSDWEKLFTKKMLNEVRIRIYVSFYSFRN